MSQSRYRGRSFGPYGCLLFLIGIGFLIAGIGSGMVPDAVTDILSQSPESNDAYSALGPWALITFGSLGLGSFGVKYYGIRNSSLWFGAILILCGIIGMIVHFSGGETSYSGNPIWVAMNFVGDIVGSLLAASIMALVGGGLLVIGMLMIGGSQGSKNKPLDQSLAGYGTTFSNQPITPGQITTCSHCGHPNPVWSAVCKKCGTHLSMAK